MRCLKCDKCLEKKCDVYRSEQLSKAWNNLLDTIGKEIGLYKLLDWLSARLK